jgi:hypothetical protein
VNSKSEKKQKLGNVLQNRSAIVLDATKMHTGNSSKKNSVNTKNKSVKMKYRQRILKRRKINITKKTTLGGKMM